MIRSADHWSHHDVETCVADVHRTTFDHLRELGLPPPDYFEGQAPFWSDERIVRWLGDFHAGHVTVDRARNPEGWEEFDRWVAQQAAKGDLDAAS